MSLNDEQIVEVILKNRIRLVAFMRSIVCDFHIAEDLYQKVCLLALQSSETFNTTSHLLKWTWVVCRNESMMYLRKQKKQPLVFNAQVLELIQSESEKPSILDNPEIISILEKCLYKLSDPMKKILEKRYRYNLTGSKLAESLNRNVKSIYVALTRAHQALYKCMHQEIKLRND